MLSPREAFGLSHAHLLKDLALREVRRVQETSKALGLGTEGLERLLALGVLADGLSESAVTELAKAGVCENPSSDIVSALSRSSWWKNGRLARLEPDAAAAAFLNLALFGQSFPKGRDALPEWMFTALRQNAATFGGRLGRILYDLHALRVLRPKDEIVHPLDERLVQMVAEKPDRAETFVDVATSKSPFWTANFAACVTLTIAERATNPEPKTVYLNNLANFLSALGRREEALAAAQEAAIFIAIWRGRVPRRSRPIWQARSTISPICCPLSAVARRRWRRRKRRLNIRRDLARARPEAFTPNLAGSLNNLANRLSDLGRREEALAAAQEAVEH